MMNEPKHICLALDIGGSKVAVAWMDPTGKVEGDIQNFPVPFDSSGAGDAQRLIEMIRPFVDCALQTRIGLRGIGLSLCGTVDAETGEAVLNPNLHWRNLPFGKMLREAFHLPVHAETDVRQAALAERTWGVAQNIRNFAWCTVGTGYGGYLCLNDQMFGGAHGFAGNFGHITLDAHNGYPCGCGRRGCVETFVAGPAIARQGQQAADHGRSPRLVELAAGQAVTPRMVFQASQEADPAAVEIVEQVMELIAMNLGGMVNLLDLEMIVMGGGVTHATPDFVQRIHSRIRPFLMTQEARRDLKIVQESFCNAALAGSAADFFIKEKVPLFDNADNI